MKEITRIEIPLYEFYRRRFGNISGKHRSNYGFDSLDEAFFREGCERGCSDLAVDYKKVNVRKPFLCLLGVSLGFTFGLSLSDMLKTEVHRESFQNQQETGYIVEEIAPVVESI